MSPSPRGKMALSGSFTAVCWFRRGRVPKIPTTRISCRWRNTIVGGTSICTSTPLRTSMGLGLPGALKNWCNGWGSRTSIPACRWPRTISCGRSPATILACACPRRKMSGRRATATFFLRKFITYLRAGLPIVVPEDQTFIADLVRDHGIGVVYGYDDHERMAEILNGQDIDRLKENVVRFREQFRIDRAVEKVLRLYDGAANSGGLSLQAVRSRRPPAKASRRDASRQGDRLPASGRSDRALLARVDGETGPVGFHQCRRVRERPRPGGGQSPVGPCEAVRGGQIPELARHVSRIGGDCDRLFELVVDLKGRPYSLYLDDPADLDLLAYFSARDWTRTAWRGPPASSWPMVGRAQGPACLRYPFPTSAMACLRAMSSSASPGARFPGKAATSGLNDYLDRFIDSRRFQGVREMLQSLAGRPDRSLSSVPRNPHGPDDGQMRPAEGRADSLRVPFAGPSDRCGFRRLAGGAVPLPVAADLPDCSIRPSCT